MRDQGSTMDQEEAVQSIAEATVEDFEVEESANSPIQEVEEEPFVKVELKNGLEYLNEAMKRGELKEIRSAYTNLTKTYPTAVT